MRNSCFTNTIHRSRIRKSRTSSQQQLRPLRGSSEQVFTWPAVRFPSSHALSLLLPQPDPTLITFYLCPSALQKSS